MSVGCARRRGEGHGAATKGLRDKFLIFHAFRPTSLRALDKRAGALHRALLCPGKILRQARGISVPFQFTGAQVIHSLPSTALLSLAKGLMLTWEKPLHQHDHAAPAHGPAEARTKRPGSWADSSLGADQCCCHRAHPGQQLRAGHCPAWHWEMVFGIQETVSSKASVVLRGGTVRAGITICKGWRGED